MGQPSGWWIPMALLRGRERRLRCWSGVPHGKAASQGPVWLQPCTLGLTSSQTAPAQVPGRPRGADHPHWPAVLGRTQPNGQGWVMGPLWTDSDCLPSFIQPVGVKAVPPQAAHTGGPGLGMCITAVSDPGHVGCSLCPHQAHSQGFRHQEPRERPHCPQTCVTPDPSKRSSRSTNS